jgi:hypothetical protein
MSDDTQTTARETGAADPAEPSGPAAPTETAVARGRASGTPFVLLGGVALVIWAVVAIVAAALLLVWWLV